MASARSILITGCSSGIGHHAAHALKACGWRVIAAVRKGEDAVRLEQEGLRAVRIDLSDPPSIADGLDAALAATGGRLDALFNNGAFGQVGALEDIEPEHLREQMEVNLVGWHDLTRRVLPIMRRQGGGRIVQCSSVLGFVAARFRGPYIASKFALEGYTDTLRAEVAPFGIKVISIQPGPITSRFRSNALARFQTTVDTQNSAYAEAYKAQLARLRSTDRGRFELGPEAVTAALIQALEARRPKTVYRVTFPTHGAALALRLLPKRWLHALQAR